MGSASISQHKLLLYPTCLLACLLAYLPAACLPACLLAYLAARSSRRISNSGRGDGCIFFPKPCALGSRWLSLLPAEPPSLQLGAPPGRRRGADYARAPVFHWLAFQRHRLLWCFTGYNFIDEELCQPKRHCSGALLATISVTAASLVLHWLLFH